MSGTTETHSADCLEIMGLNPDAAAAVCGQESKSKGVCERERESLFLQNRADQMFHCPGFRMIQSAAFICQDHLGRRGREREREGGGQQSVA